MSFGNGEKPPVNAKYAEAVAKQRGKSGKGGGGKKPPAQAQSTLARQFLFMAEYEGLPVIFVCYGQDNRSAIANAVRYCEHKGYKYGGWMPYRKSAYLRVV